MSFKTITYQTIALAGVAQAVYLVDSLATKGEMNTQDFEVCIKSLLTFEMDNPMDIYGGLAGIKTGLQQLHKQLSTTQIPIQIKHGMPPLLCF